METWSIGWGTAAAVLLTLWYEGGEVGQGRHRRRPLFRLHLRVRHMSSVLRIDGALVAGLIRVLGWSLLRHCDSAFSGSWLAPPPLIAEKASCVSSRKVVHIPLRGEWSMTTFRQILEVLLNATQPVVPSVIRK